ncbi:9417_t:CDS:2, partial [Funneliformis geosporum]
LRIKEYHGKSDPVEKAHDFSNVKESWSNVDLVAYTSTLKIGVSCTNPKRTNRSIMGSIYVGEIPFPATIWLENVVKVNSATVKAEEILEITNAIILDHETAELLENKPRKALEEIRSLDWRHIVECYQIPPELLTEDFISEYRNYNHMKWFRAYRQ